MINPTMRRAAWPVIIIAGVTAVLYSQGTSPAPVMFRGDPQHHGTYPASRATAFAGMRWRVQTQGPVRSSPAVTATTVYIGSNDGHLYAIDRVSGDLRWQSEALGAISSSPAVADGLVIVTTPSGCVALDMTDGRERWHVGSGTALPFPWGHESGDRYLGSPVIVGTLALFGGGDGIVRAIELKSGGVRWSVPLGTRLRSSPAVSGNRVVIGGIDGSVYALDLASGKSLWRFDTEGHTLNSAEYGFDRRTIQSSPAIADSLVIVGARDGFVYGLALADGKQRWRMDHHVSWINASPAIADGMAIVGTSDGHFTQAIDLRTGAERWRTASQNIVWGSVAAAGTALYVGDGSGFLYALDRATGAVRWRWRGGGAILSSPVVADSTVYFGSDDGGVYAMGLTEGPPLHRAVFWDSTLTGPAFFRGQEMVRRWFRGREYDSLNVATLGPWLDRQVASGGPSVVVFAMDAFPPADTARFRHYLEGGGKVVWLGVPPLLWPTRPDGNIDLKDVNRAAPRGLLGVSFEHGNFDPIGATPTEEGKRWGLQGWLVSNWGADTTGIEVLARDNDGLAAAWVRRFGGPPGSGFVRLFGVDWGEISGQMPSALLVQISAEHFPR